MSILKVFSIVTISTLFMVTGVQAKPPFIDYQWNGYEGSQKQCVQRARTLLQDMEFIMSPSTGNQEAIGYKADYKGVIACLPDYKMVIFMVAGPIYKQAELLSKRLKNNF